MLHEPPNILKIQRLRSQVQKKLNININEARVWCSSACLTDPHIWLGWELGTYEMHPGLFQLLQLKLTMIDPELMQKVPLPAVRYTLGLSIYRGQSSTYPTKQKPVKSSKKLT